jgi:hypothetical protein
MIRRGHDEVYSQVHSPAQVHGLGEDLGRHREEVTMTDFKIEIRARTADHDADVMLQFPEALMERFHGTAIKITSVSTENLTLAAETGNDQLVTG